MSFLIRVIAVAGGVLGTSAIMGLLLIKGATSAMQSFGEFITGTEDDEKSSR